MAGSTDVVVASYKGNDFLYATSAGSHYIYGQQLSKTSAGTEVNPGSRFSCPHFNFQSSCWFRLLFAGSVPVGGSSGLAYWAPPAQKPQAAFAVYSATQSTPNYVNVFAGQKYWLA